jgi:hypothetical protein
VPEFKDAIFAYESAALPAELKIVDGCVEKFKALPEAATTLVQVAHTLDEAATLIDQFKIQTCGSTYSLALINISMLADVQELKFLLRVDVVGDPRTIFVASLRYMTGDIYAYAKDKVQRENEIKERTASCIDCYGAGGHEETLTRTAQLMAAYLREAEARAEAKRQGISVVGESPAETLLRKSTTTFYGRRFKGSRPPGAASSSTQPGTGG